jgi:poly-gamma-glutamate capsule biosynthesis protein CapA/YwtB (metallophosphatase superfamily)
VNFRRNRKVRAALVAVVASMLAVTTTASGENVINSVPRTAARVAPPSRSFSLIATGDVLTEAAVTSAASATATSGARYDFAPLFEPVAAMISSADVAICHMETPIGRPGERAGVYGNSPFGGHLILAPFEVAAGLRAVGFDRCSTASNHSNDLAEPAIDTTLAALDAAGISHVGTARSAAESATTLLSVNGVRLAHLSYTRYSNTLLPAEPWRLNFAVTPSQVAGDVAAARVAGAEVVVVSLHIVQELLPAPLSADRQFVTELTALAHIDLIVEHGPHVIQPVEQVNGTWVYWSVGNVISGMGTADRGVFADPRTLDELAAAVRFTETSPGVFGVESWPILLCNDPLTRRVYAPITALATLPLAAGVRSNLEACVQRAAPVAAGLH